MAPTGYTRMPTIFERCKSFARENGATEQHLAGLTYRQFTQHALNGHLPATIRINDRWWALDTAVPQIAVAAGMVSAQAITHSTLNEAA